MIETGATRLLEKKQRLFGLQETLDREKSDLLNKVSASATALSLDHREPHTSVCTSQGFCLSLMSTGVR